MMAAVDRGIPWIVRRYSPEFLDDDRDLSDMTVAAYLV